MQYITSKDNNMVKHISKLIKGAAYRKECGEYIVEGARLCTDALVSGANIATAVFSQQAAEKYSEQVSTLCEVCESTFVFSDKLFSQISDTKTPQGIMCICKINDKAPDFSSDGVFLALEHIQDPSNMGTILRTAEALGVKGVVLTDNCCDVYSPKVVRGTMGAVFRLPLMFCSDLKNIIDNCNAQKLNTIATVVSGNAVSITELSKNEKKHCMLLIGNEGNGLEQDTINKCGIKVTIPMLGRAESLNASAAAAISMWELLRGLSK